MHADSSQASHRRKSCCQVEQPEYPLIMSTVITPAGLNAPHPPPPSLVRARPLQDRLMWIRKRCTRRFCGGLRSCALAAIAAGFAAAAAAASAGAASVA